MSAERSNGHSNMRMFDTEQRGTYNPAPTHTRRRAPHSSRFYKGTVAAVFLGLVAATWCFEEPPSRSSSTSNTSETSHGLTHDQFGGPGVRSADFYNHRAIFGGNPK